MKKFTAAVAVLASVLVAGSAQAAVIEGVTGPVRVNTGEGFVPFRGEMELNAGDQVMVGKGGSAKLVYGPDCALTIPAGSVASVSSTLPCGRSQVVDGGTGIGTGGIVIGTVLLAGGITGIVLLTRNNNNNNNFPVFFPTISR